MYIQNKATTYKTKQPHTKQSNRMQNKATLHKIRLGPSLKQVLQLLTLLLDEGEEFPQVPINRGELRFVPTTVGFFLQAIQSSRTGYAHHEGANPVVKLVRFFPAGRPFLRRFQPRWERAVALCFLMRRHMKSWRLLKDWSMRGN